MKTTQLHTCATGDPNRTPLDLDLASKAAMSPDHPAPVTRHPWSLSATVTIVTYLTAAHNHPGGGRDERLSGASAPPPALRSPPDWAEKPADYGRCD